MCGMVYHTPIAFQSQFHSWQSVRNTCWCSTTLSLNIGQQQYLLCAINFGLFMLIWNPQCVSTERINSGLTCDTITYSLDLELHKLKYVNKEHFNHRYANYVHVSAVGVRSLHVYDLTFRFGWTSYCPLAVVWTTTKYRLQCLIITTGLNSLLPARFVCSVLCIYPLLVWSSCHPVFMRFVSFCPLSSTTFAQLPGNNGILEVVFIVTSIPCLLPKVMRFK